MVTPGSFRFHVDFRVLLPKDTPVLLTRSFPALQSSPALRSSSFARRTDRLCERSVACAGRNVREPWRSSPSVVLLGFPRDLERQPCAFSSLCPLRLPEELPEGQVSVCQTLTLLLSSLPDSVRGPQPPAPHRPGQLCESSQQEPRGRLGAVPVPVRAGQRHPGPRQWQQAHPLQVSDALHRGWGGRCGARRSVDGRDRVLVQGQKPAFADGRVMRDPPNSVEFLWKC